MELNLSRNWLCNLRTFHLDLNGGGGRQSGSSGGDMKAVKKVDKKVLCLCNFSIKFFDIIFCLSNYIFFYL